MACMESHFSLFQEFDFSLASLGETFLLSGGWRGRNLDDYRDTISLFGRETEAFIPYDQPLPEPLKMHQSIVVTGRVVFGL